MFACEKFRSDLLPLVQDDRQGDDESSSEAMFDNENLGSKPQSRIRRLCCSNVPWIFTTIVLSLYIFAFAPALRMKDVPWSPTDIGKHHSNPINEWLCPKLFTVYIRHLIEESSKTFTSGLDYNNPNHTLQHTPSEGLRFIGVPSAEIDAAWAEIAGGKPSAKIVFRSARLTGTLVQETFLTKEGAITSSVEHTFVSPLTGLPVVE
jgi:hypothetical protein